MPSVVIASTVRTPIGRFGGALALLTAVDLGVIAVKETMARAGIEPHVVDEVIFGHARAAGNGPNPARQIGFRSGIPQEVPACTVNKACGSGLKAIIFGIQQIMLGEAKVIVAGGTESMSRVPYLVDGGRWGLRMGNHQLADAMYRDGFFCPISDMLMGETAESLASLHRISRDEQDEYAVRSHRRAAAATRSGRFETETVKMEKLVTDEHLRVDASIEDMRALPPVFSKTGTVTAGNSSGITDGAAATILMAEDEAVRLNVKPMARIVGYATAGVDPRVMGIAPVPAIRNLLRKTGMKLDDFDLVELNEAFAAQVLACLREQPIDPERLNVNGGAIALGHPIGCTGARIVATLAHEMQKRRARYGLATLCISGGLGLALGIERL
jgi:acetyl-CoA C-acetyltransferase